MKLPILPLILIFFSKTIYAQNPRVELGNPRMETYAYQKGGDSICFTILGKNDTIKETGYFKNGKVYYYRWKTDSSYYFDALGHLASKHFNLESQRNYGGDTQMSFYSNGQLFTYSTRKNKQYIQNTHGKDGRLLMSSVSKNDSGTYYSRIADRNDVSIKVNKNEFILLNNSKVQMSYDTVFYETGQPCHIIVKKNSETVIQKDYKPDGKLFKLWAIDSSTMLVFKDNIACAYGLMNKQGDTIVKPRFSRIDPFGNGYWAAHSDDTAILLNSDGSIKKSTYSPFSSLSMVSPASFYTPQKYNIQSDVETRSREIRNQPFYYWKFFKDGKIGIMDEEAQLIMPPQYFSSINQANSSGKLFNVSIYENREVRKSIIVDTKGTSIFPKRYNYVQFLSDSAYYFLSINPEAGQSRAYRFDDWGNSSQQIRTLYFETRKNNLGLGKSDGTVVLEPNFLNINIIPNSHLAIASLVKGNDSTELGYFNDGIYDIKAKRWVLDTSNFVIRNEKIWDAEYFVIEHLTTLKYGIMNKKGKFILPLTYDSIGIVDDLNGLFWVKKKGKYQILDVKNGSVNIHKPKYDFLSSIKFTLPYDIDKKNLCYFFAKQGDKWGVIDVTDKVLKLFEYEYVSKNFGNDSKFLMVKDGKVAVFTLNSFPNEDDLFGKYDNFNEMASKSYPLVDNSDRFFCVNEAGKVTIPPQYKRIKKELIYQSNDYALVEDANEEQKIIFFDSGKVIDYPYDYEIKFANSKYPFVVVGDAGGSKYGVFSTQATTLADCTNYSVAMGASEDSCFFVRHSPPGYEETSSPKDGRDTLSSKDNNWEMYNNDGKKLRNDVFRLPINFKQGVGLGVIGDNFNLFRTDGSVLQPFRANKSQNTEGGIKGFRNIRRDPKTGFYVLFTQLGLMPTLMLTKSNGEIIVENGKYSGMSLFYDKYAFVLSNNKVGLIDSFGKEIIAPQDLRSYKGQFLDSLNLFNKKYRQLLLSGQRDADFYNMKPINQPIEFSHLPSYHEHPDSLKISDTLRNALLNLLLEVSLDKTVGTAFNWDFPRIAYQTTVNNFSSPSKFNNKSQVFTRRISVTENTIAFILSKWDYEFGQYAHFYNFQRVNNRWEDFKINDLLNIQGTKREEMNNLIVQKVKALKDQEIDCSNTATFITTVENRFLITKDGVEFYFDSLLRIDNKFVVISCTWTELLPFVKIQLDKAKEMNVNRD